MFCRFRKQIDDKKGNGKEVKKEWDGRYRGRKMKEKWEASEITT